MKYTKKLESLLIQKELKIEALYRQSSREGLVCSILDTITFLLDDLRHNIFNIYLIYNSSLQTPGDPKPSGSRRDQRAYRLIKNINYQQHILIGLNEKLRKGEWSIPREGEYTDINKSISNCVKQIRNNPLFPSGTRITMNLNDHIPAVEFRDCDLFQVIYHNISRSIDSAEQGQPSNIEITTDMIDRDLLIRISDNCSPPPDEGTEIELSGVPGGDGEGRGDRFGLCACRNIIDSCGGRFIIEKGYPEGTVVKIVLKINQRVKGSSGSKNIS
ncbi:MAG: hypothetical protein GF417_09080 [Candidatus Latescibacteria bacterium]|nr:hypothetical protein [bacterium]MBD3424576.1 hypothetical protein [Candidatus Latescibacterota bacterium]